MTDQYALRMVEELSLTKGEEVVPETD